MKFINKSIIYATAAVIGIGMSSCNDWLDVKMEDQVMENVLFDNYKGYLTALNGVYLNMNDLYSTTLSTTSLDVMAQYYNVTTANDHKFKLYSTYGYSDKSFENANSQIWSQAYSILANINVIIDRTGVDNPLTEKQRNIIRGEALALRAFIHFDLLRLYGPIYSENPTAESIPYQGSSSREIQPILPADKVAEKIMADLKEAESLLAKSDPIITEGVKRTDIEDNGILNYDMSFRQLRMNYYAVELMIARLYLWTGDKENAYNVAKNNIIDKVTTEDLTVFPWTTRNQVTAEGKPDYLFSSEVFFALYNTLREKNVYAPNFSRSLRAITSRLTFIGNSLDGEESKAAKFYDDKNDLRLLMWEVVDATEEEKKAAEADPWSNEGKSTLALNKFKPFEQSASTSDADIHQYMIPLMRLSEAYLIAAECAQTEDEGRKFLNTLREKRECLDLDPEANFDNAIMYEFAREVIGEGQLFYFYKRRGAQTLIGSKGDWYGNFEPTFSMVKANYVMPLPKDEIDKRVEIK